MDKRIFLIVTLILLSFFLFVFLTINTITELEEKVENAKKNQTETNQTQLEANKTQIVNQTNIEKHENISIKDFKYVAHAGGEINSMTYTNSKESLNYNYENGFRFFEIDFEWTTDNEVVALHNWNHTIENYFGLEQKRHSLEVFKNANMTNNLTQMTFDDVASWLKQHPDAYLITDTKKDNKRFLKEIVPKSPEIINNIIPQAMSFEDYKLAKKLGYKNIILTLYQTYYNDYEILEFVEKNNVFAVTMHQERGFSDLPEKLEEKGVYTWAFTVNDKDLMKELKNNNIDGFYTDSLKPN